MSNLRSKVILLFLVAVTGSSNALLLQEGMDSNFTEWLGEKMTEYGKWIQDNGYDPSPPIPDVVTLSTEDFARISLSCDISNQVIKGHSLTSGDVPLVDGSIAKHYAVIGREVHQEHSLEGEFTCTGTIRAGSLENNTELPFSGYGNFLFSVSYSDEIVEMVNIGITEEQKFDLAHSWSRYAYFPTLGDVQFVGVWGPGEITSYMTAVRTVFRMIYYDHLTRDRRPQAPINPSRVILEKYLNEILGNADLGEIIDGDLPPYSPTPSTSTTETSIVF